MQLITLSFGTTLHPGNLTAFRAAMSDCAGRQHELLHHHDNSTEANHLHWQYPLVQYRMQQGRVAINGINAGADLIRQHLLPTLPEQVVCAGQTLDLRRYMVQRTQVPLAITDHEQTFGVFGWIALNQENYRLWQAQATNPVAQLQVLSQALTGHLRAQAEGLQLPWAKLIQAEVLEVHDTKKVQWHGNDLVRFDVIAQSAYAPPNGLSVGRMSAYGYGEIMPVPTYIQAGGTRRNRRQAGELLDSE
jgi:Cas6b N-terminal domain